ncbi:MAG TPA: FAD-dependent oxidoreductase [Bryobacteraceae bacterium]|nr:FAD-dependent oxidoreductase [Bryobacteraceae bacterium]
MTHALKERYDVVIVGAGLAGLTLARHLLLYTNQTVLLIDKRANPAREAPQKFGESLVQASGYYLAKVLDLEDYLLTNHYIKYNLRFHWPTYGLENLGYEDYSQSYIRSMSNIATYQLDRNLLEEHLLAANLENPRCQFIGGARNTAAELSETGGLHRVHFGGGDVRCRWLVDASGRGKILQRQLGLAEMNPIRHGAIFCWVDGLVNVEKLTGRPHPDILYDSRRRRTGHLPVFLGTNHFCAEGQWLWVIPLHHKTSLGLVYDHGAVDPDKISNTRKMIDYVCRTWPLLARDLPHRKIIDEGRMIDFSHSCRQTISPQRWALVGDAGRFSDPLYSPGTDLISIYNTLIVDAIQAEDDRALEEKCRLAEQIQRVMYESYVPSYSISYDCLGDQEVFTLKYSWELAIYFGFFVLPMINNLFANAEFMPVFLRRFAILGPLNAGLQRYLSAFFQWKKRQSCPKSDAPSLFELYDVTPLREAETLFYEAGLGPQEAIQVVDRHLERLKEFARYILTHVHASVMGDREVLTNAAFIASLKLRDVTFDPAQMKAAYSRYAGAKETYRWNLNPFALDRFVRQPAAEPVGAQHRM